MKIKILFSLPLLLFSGFSCTSMNQSTQFERFFAWNLPADQASLQPAAALGVTDGTVVVSNLDQIHNARQYGIRPYSYLLPIESLWDEYGDGGPAPLQVMSQEENDCFNLLHHSDAGQKIRAERHHQFGGEPAAWFFPWPQEKIRQYSKQIGSYPRGVPFIGYYDATKRPEFPQKTAETVERELTEMSHSGAQMVMVYDFADVLADPQVRKIFARQSLAPLPPNKLS